MFDSPQSFFRIEHYRAATRTAVSGGSKITFTFPAATPWPQEAASQSAKREAKSLWPDERLHVQFSHEVTPLEPRGRLHGAAKAASADAPTQPIRLSQGLD